MLSTRRMEHGTPLLADFDLGALLRAQVGFQKQEDEAVRTFMRILGDAGKARAVRRLSAVARATDDQLREAEANPAVLAALEEEAAARPYAETFQDAVGFFIEWGTSFKTDPNSSPQGKAKGKAKGKSGGSPSGGS